MGKKVTKAIIRNNMESYDAFVEHADHIGAVVDGEPMDVSPFAVGAQSMAQYVCALIDGEVAVENDMTKLTNVIVQVSLAAYLDGGDDHDGDDGPSWFDGLLGRLAGQGGCEAGEGGDADGAE